MDNKTKILAYKTAMMSGKSILGSAYLLALKTKEYENNSKTKKVQ